VKTVRNPSEIYFGRNLGRNYNLRRGFFGQRAICPNSVRKRIFVRNPWEISVNSVPKPSEIPFENDIFLVVRTKTKEKKLHVLKSKAKQVHM